MRWFKHMTRSWDDERISRLVERAGLEGYGFYFRLVEIIAANMEENSEPNATYSAQKWSKLTAIFKPKVQKLCEVCSNLGLIEFENNSDLLKVSIPKIIKYRDEYSVKQGRKKVKSPDTVGTLSGVAPEQEQIQIEKQIQNISCEEKPKRKKRSAEVDSEFIEKMRECYPGVDIELQKRKADAWIISHPGRKMTRQFFNRWLSKSFAEVETKQQQLDAFFADGPDDETLGRWEAQIQKGEPIR